MTRGISDSGGWADERCVRLLLALPVVVLAVGRVGFPVADDLGRGHAPGHG